MPQTAETKKSNTMKRLTILTLAALAFTVSTTSCERENDNSTNDDASVVPTKFAVDIPDAISSEETLKASYKTSGGDTLKGDKIYRHLRHFIRIGEGAAEVVQGTIWAISYHNINQAMTMTFTSDEDGREKYLEVLEDVTFEDREWEFQLTISDEASMDAEDGGKAIQVFWNQSPIEGIAIMKPFNINRNDVKLGQAMFRVDYSEAGELGYDNHMFVSISGLPLPGVDMDRFATRSIQMFAGRTGDIVDVYGNSNHPNARFFSEDEGFNWAFTATADRSKEVGCAEVGLPPSSLDSDSRSEILEDYSVEDVFTHQIHETWPEADSAMVRGLLTNTQAPGYFTNGGFVQAETAPSDDHSAIVGRLMEMTPFNPLDVAELEVAFK